MGCCVSKCKPKRQFMEEMTNHVHVHVQDKLVISQTPRTPLSASNRISPLPLSSTSNSSSASYFTGSATTTSSSSTATSRSSKPGSSPALTSKNRSFSNEFLLACVKDNPHIIRMNSIKEAPLKVAISKPQAQVLLQPPPQAVVASTPQRPKRVRSSSPTAATVLARQKSFRREAETANPAAVLPSRTLRSPSPSRRFSNAGDKNVRGILASLERESESKRVVGTKVNALNSVYSTLARENSRAASLMNDSVRPCSRNRETRVHRVSSKIDEVAVDAALSEHQISESFPPEDFDNPLISLDCFIFL